VRVFDSIVFCALFTRERERENRKEMRENATLDEDEEEAATSPRGGGFESSGGKKREDEEEKRKTRTTPEEKEALRDILKAMERSLLMEGGGGGGGGEQQQQLVGNVKKRKEHKFWSTQPVPQFEIEEEGEDEEEGKEGKGGKEDAGAKTADEGEDDEGDLDDGDGPIDDPSKTAANVRKEGYDLPPGYEWDEVDVDTQEGRDEVFTLLANNYVEDDDEMFRFAYAPEFVSWALQPPGYEKSWHVGIRISCTKTLVALITGIPAEVSANGKRLKVAEINFLCVHKKLRRKNFAPVLIREVTRRINLKDVWQAAYTAGVVLPKPCAKARYWHRSINVKKLVDIRFTQLGRGMSMAETIEHYAMPKKIRVQGLRKMEAKDVPTVTRLLNSYFSKFKLAPVKNEEDVRHWLVPRDEVVYSYVKIDERTNEATDFCSFYNLSSAVIQASSGGSNAKRNNVLLKAAYCYYNVATSENIEDLVQDALILARDNGFDVFNALNVSENAQFLETLKFGIGDGDLHYYLYNWKLKETLAPKDVALVLL
jgi:glycylpeptide N-tetradecanoyltransferase